MIKRIFAGVAATVALFAGICPFSVGGAAVSNPQELSTISEVNIPSEASKVEEEIETEVIILEPSVVERVETADLETLIQEMEKCISRQENAHSMAAAARSLGYAEDHPIIVLAQSEWTNAHNDYNYYKEIYTPLKVAEDERKAEEERKKKEAEEAEKKRQQEEQKSKAVVVPTGQYDTATYIWNYMKSLGWNDAVCAGIMGNIMAEVGGNTLSINPCLYSSSGYYYGICQWNRSAYSGVHGASLDAQLNYLRDTIQYEMNTYGKSYGGYSGFLTITDAGYAAKAFATSYERCGSWSGRSSNAYVAYAYFVN